MSRGHKHQRGDSLTAAGLGLLSLGLYAITAAPSVATVFDDSLEFQVVLPTLGIAHPSGYPLYTLLGKLATLALPFRDPAGRANLLSAVCAAAAVAVLYLAARRIAGSRAAAVVATAAFAISPAWWSQATIAEVYALHGLLYVTAVYLLLRAEEALSAGVALATGGSKTDGGAHLLAGDRWLAGACLAMGLGLAHHRMMALLLPAALLLVAWSDRTLLRQPRRWLRPLFLLVVPLLAYLYLPLRGRFVSSLDGAYRPDLRGTLEWILARGYSVFLTGNPFGVERHLGFYLGLLIQQLGVFLFTAAVLGLAWAWRLRARRYCFLALATGAQIAFAVSYKVQDVAVFFLPVFMLLALWAAWGLAPILDGVTRQAAQAGGSLRLPVRARPAFLATWLLVLAALLLLEPVRHAVRLYPDLDRSDEWSAYDLGQHMVDSVAPGGQVVGLLGETTLVRYFRDVLGQHPDIAVAPADAEQDRFAAVDAALAAGRPVYLTRDLPAAAERYSLDAAGPLIEVSPKATPAVAPPGSPVGGGIVLIEAQTAVRRARGGPVVSVEAVWTAPGPVGEVLKVSARLIDGRGKTVAQDDQAPVHFAYPTTAWVPGETVRDAYDLAPPGHAAAGSYGVLLIVYRASDSSEVGRVDLPPITID